jgi:hypothetical protein
MEIERFPFSKKKGFKHISFTQKLQGNWGISMLGEKCLYPGLF